MRTVELPGWGEMLVYVCAGCGHDFFIGAVQCSPGFPFIDEAAARRAIIGDPPRCYDCREELRP